MGASLRSAVDRAVEIVAGVLFVLMCALVLAQIVARKLGDPLVWSEELARYIFIWVAFLGLVIAARRGSHISIRLIYDRLGTRARSTLGIVIECATIVLALIFLRYGWLVILSLMMLGVLSILFAPFMQFSGWLFDLATMRR